MATHVLGMAKSCLDLKGAKSSKVELDFLRLLYAVQKIEDNGESAIGCFFVGNEKVKKTVETWFNKYGFSFKSKIEILTLEQISKNDYEKLLTEKARNSKGNIRHNDKSISKEYASGKIGKEIFEKALTNHLKSKYKIKEIISDNKPFGINWDFYHQIKK